MLSVRALDPHFFIKPFPNILVPFGIFDLYISATNDQTENDKIKLDQLEQVIDLNAKLLSNAASTYAYNKINTVLLMQILTKAEGRDLEEIRINVDK